MRRTSVISLVCALAFIFGSASVTAQEAVSLDELLRKVEQGKVADTTFLESDAWRALRIMGEFIDGFDTLAEYERGQGQLLGHQTSKREQRTLKAFQKQAEPKQDVNESD